MGHKTFQRASDWSERELIAIQKWKRFSHYFVEFTNFLNEDYRMVYHNVIDAHSGQS